MFGEEGDDILLGSRGFDKFYGGPGDDRFDDLALNEVAVD